MPAPAPAITQSRLSTPSPSALPGAGPARTPGAPGRGQVRPLRETHSGLRILKAIRWRVGGSLAAGVNRFQGRVVPTGRAWLIENIIMQYTGTVTAVEMHGELQHSGGLTSWPITRSVLAPVSASMTDVVDNPIWVFADETIDFLLAGATLNDTALMWIYGIEVAYNAAEKL